MKKKHQRSFLNTKALATLIFAVGFVLGLVISPYLNKTYLGADLFTDPSYDPTTAACVRYDSTDSMTTPPTPHRYECWDTLVVNSSEYGNFHETMWQCYNDGVAVASWYVPYADHGGECQ